MYTSFHSKYFAYELTRQCSSHQLEKLRKSIFNAKVDLNPHQLDAALFAFCSPLSKGAILADEVGLGKTIEACLIISQLWAENKRKILCITPASLRKQWQVELSEKFFINSKIIESKYYKMAIKKKCKNPYELKNKVGISSFQFVKNKIEDVSEIPWDLVIIDEAHRLRNVYKNSNKIAKAIHSAIANRPKVLLTATPLQNSLMELYGLVSFIDMHIFGSIHSFREQFLKHTNNQDCFYTDLRNRIKSVCQRTLRRQVIEYIKFTNRISITQDFSPTDKEYELYEYVSTYLQRNSNFAISKNQKSLITLVIRKILASSTFAITATLDKLIKRLELMAKQFSTNEVDNLNDDYETLDELIEEWQYSEDNTVKSKEINENEQKNKQQDILREIFELKKYQTLAKSIKINAKGEALLKALINGFKELGHLNAPQKALIFTESRRTQQYLYYHLSNNGYEGKVIVLNGTNTEKDSIEIYQKWLIKHKGKDCISGSKEIDMRAAIVEAFKKDKSIMIATESGAEGLNLQFCNLVVNYDLPWNPQRIEQRIGRCHRYGQSFDVVVVNFINRRNEADQRVFELLSTKLRLFDGIFGSSDEIIGALESGVDFEKRINDIYQSCRTSYEINNAFDALQEELNSKIQNKMKDAHIKLMEHFDEDVHKRLRINFNNAKIQINDFEKWLWLLTKYELNNCADFDDDSFTFSLNKIPENISSSNIEKGSYRLITHKSDTNDHLYRLNHPLAEQIIETSKKRTLSCNEIVFDYSNHPTKISVIANLLNKSGWLALSSLCIKALETEEHLVFCGLTLEGKELDENTCKKLFKLSGETGSLVVEDKDILAKIKTIENNKVNDITSEVAVRNTKFFEYEMDKLDKWADDLKSQLEQDIKNLDKEINEIKKNARKESELDLKLKLHKEIKHLEKKRKEKRHRLFEAQDGIENKKESLISEIESTLNQTSTLNNIFTIKWRVK